MSISPRDAERAAAQERWQAAELEFVRKRAALPPLGSVQNLSHICLAS
ncbi:MAG: hypothetical protein KKD33_10240 [Verrucomicrobia bacterium]|nr:hypothetical protein [Verrucomicrobiota bacterium]